MSVAISNLNYRLNGLCPIYVLYRPENKELPAAFARDEWARLERENPSWRDQGNVTIYFKEVVVPHTLARLRSRIVEEATVQRSVNERLNAVRGTAAQVVVHAEGLAVVDSAQAVELVLFTFRRKPKLGNSRGQQVTLRLGSFDQVRGCPATPTARARRRAV